MGRGGFGLVFVAERISDGVEVAVKFIIKEKVPVSAWTKDPDLGIIPRECYILKHINHPCIIKYLDCYSDRKYFYLVMELHGSSWSKNNIYKNNYQNEKDNNNKMYTSFINAAALKTNNNFHVGKVRPSMDLFECIESYFECFDENQARYIFVQLLSAIKYLNSLSIIHRDIKDENILIDRDLNIKLIDFGAAIQIKGGRVYDKFVGTVPYIAPEIINGQEYGSLTQDIYSLGVLLHLLIYGELPAINLNKDDSSSLNLPQCTIKGNYCSEKVRHLIRWMLQKSPSSRPTLDEILDHDWIKEKTN
ncbi:kinase-like protein [Anaeromyces robustus]|uniref:Kinase-like protein n=1 Tax=Anaeromyces robustus TaxID=1754192 RepID=A0A1Y1WWT9_9FUNG|nr:kinase-like protein [Anaeromyces robustus]|eukprot:ORX78007.1 kinase-like protein [Anaeromyces robustus]